MFTDQNIYYDDDGNTPKTYLHIRHNLTHTTIWMNFENFIPSKISQIPYDSAYMRYLEQSN